jgi:hypothetical protein
MGENMDDIASAPLEEHGRAALSLMEQALELLDRCTTGHEVGAHLDLAICRLRAILWPGSAEISGSASAPERSEDGDCPWSQAS